MTSRPPTIDTLGAEMIGAIRDNAGHFPSYIQARGRAYLREGRVGPLEIDRQRITATVRGTRGYRTTWRWNGHDADPQCTCPAGPVCKHAYALARAIDAARPDRAAIAANAAREAAREARASEARGRSFRGLDPRGGEPAIEPTPQDLAEDLTDWAYRHRATPSRALRVVFGLDRDESSRPVVWMEARLTSRRLADAPRSAQQILQLASELRRDPTLLAPPHARLLRVLSATVSHAGPFDGETRFEIEASAINRLLDSFSNTTLATWSESDPAVAERGGVAAGGRLRLGETAVDILPAFHADGADLRIILVARWPDGRRRRLDEAVYIPPDDDLHPSLVLADGAFWRVAEEPPPQLIRRFVATGSLIVPEAGRERFLELLVASFPSVGDALTPHVRVHRVRPVITLDLDPDDWLHVRLFAHTGDDTWRPGLDDPGVVAFELSPEAQWLRCRTGGEASEARERVGDSGDDVRTPSPTAVDGESETAAPVWIETPDPALVASARQWLAELPLVSREQSDDGSDHADGGAWIHLGTRQLKMFAETWDRRPSDVVFLGNARMRNLLGESRAITARLHVVASGVDWFAVSAEWQAEGLALTEAELAKLRSSRTRFVKLSSGWVHRDWVRRLDATAEMLADLGIEVGAGEQRLSVAQLAQASPESLAALETLGVDSGVGQEIERLRERVRSFAGVPRVEIPKRLEATLRPYQHDGLDFLAFVTGLGLGAVLADDMGLGKTVQALAWIEWLRERDPEGGPVLVVCPASVVHNWLREAERFTPHLRVLALTSGKERHALQREVPHHDLVVSNYALVRRDLERWRAIPLRAAILDEAQNIKNPDAAVSRAVLELNARHRLALTGTPLENRALDLWSIMRFVNPGYLGPRAAFVARYDTPDAPPSRRRLLAARLRPVMVRRLKEQVATDLPDRIEEHRECELTPGQRKLYLAELMRGRSTVDRLKNSPDGLARNKIEILAALTRLRQVCCHPALAGGREDLGSGKFDALFEILEPLLAEERKVLVFSQFVRCLELLATEMKRRGIRHHMLIGSTTKRESVVRGFETDPDPCVFLISLKAGGTGLNLTAASYVVLFDPWWNPAVEAQAIDRAHRIGQTRTVIAYRLLAAGTIEDKIWELQQRKAALVAGVLGEDGFARALTPGDLDYLLG